MIVRRIENLGNDFRLVFFLHAAQVVSLGKQLHIEVRDIPCSPQAQNGNGVAVFARNHHIVRNGLDLFIPAVSNVQTVFRPVFLDPAVELYGKRFIASLREPDLAAGKPDVGKLSLPAVHDFLLEQAVIIANGIPHRRIIARSERVHKTCSKAA